MTTFFGPEKPHPDGTILNVTPQEYAELKIAASFGAAHFESYVRRNYGCDSYIEYRVKVRRDVPSVPWYSADCTRFELPKQPAPKGGG